MSSYLLLLYYCFLGFSALTLSATQQTTEKEHHQYGAIPLNESGPVIPISKNGVENLKKGIKGLNNTLTELGNAFAGLLKSVKDTIVTQTVSVIGSFKNNFLDNFPVYKDIQNKKKCLSNVAEEELNVLGQQFILRAEYCVLHKYKEIKSALENATGDIFEFTGNVKANQEECLSTYNNSKLASKGLRVLGCLQYIINIGDWIDEVNRPLLKIGIKSVPKLLKDNKNLGHKCYKSIEAYTKEKFSALLSKAVSCP